MAHGAPPGEAGGGERQLSRRGWERAARGRLLSECHDGLRSSAPGVKRCGLRGAVLRALRLNSAAVHIVAPGAGQAAGR